jgi:hypothetical protein
MATTEGERERKRLMQLAWRENALDEGRVGPSLCMHLTRAEAAILDHIAIELYEQHPHDPHHELEAGWLTPGRAAAVRRLIERELIEGNQARTLGRLVRMQRKLGKFWIREASWRRTTKNTSPEKRPPKPPWRSR